jgi:hypothetical protein
MTLSFPFMASHLCCLVRMAVASLSRTATDRDKHGCGSSLAVSIEHTSSRWSCQPPFRPTFASSPGLDRAAHVYCCAGCDATWRRAAPDLHTSQRHSLRVPMVSWTTKKTTVVRTVCRKLNELCGDKPEPCDHNRFRMARTVVRGEQ